MYHRFMQVVVAAAAEHHPEQARLVQPACHLRYTLAVHSTERTAAAVVPARS